MIVHIDRDGAVSIRDAEDFTRFSISIDAPIGDAALIARKLAPEIDVESPEHAWVDADLLVRASGHQGDEAWRGGFDKMMTYAKSAGWTRQNGKFVRGHIDWRP